MAHHVFISYSRRDAAQAEALEQRLRREAEVWFDRRDIPVSVPWLDEVVDAVRGASVVVLCHSDAWAASENCRLEAREADAAGKPIVVVDISGSTEACADQVLRRVRALTDDERHLTAAMVRTDQWIRSGCSGAGLLSRSEVRAFVGAEQHLGTTYELATRRLIESSRRRLRRRRALFLGGGALAAVAMLVFSVFRGAQERGQERVAVADQAFTEAAALRARSSTDVYAGLREGSTAIAGGHTEFLVRDRLGAALDIPVPDRSVVVHGAVRFAGSPAEGRAIVLDRAGRAFGITDRVTPSGRPSRGPVAPVLAVPAKDGTSRIEVTTASGALVRWLPVNGRPGPVAVSPEGHTVAVGVGADVHLLDVSSGLDRSVLRGSIGLVSALAWSTEGDRVWALEQPDRVTSWVVRHGPALVNDPAAWYVALGPSNVRGHLEAVRRDGAIDEVDLEGAPRRTRRTSASAVTAGAVDPVHGLVALGGDDRVVIASAGGGERVVTLPNCTSTGAAFSHDGSRLFVVCGEGAVFGLDPQSGAVRARATAGDERAWSVAVDARGDVFVGGAGRIFLGDAGLSHLEMIRDHDDYFSPLRSVAVADDGNTLLAVGDGTGKVGYAVSGKRDGDGHWTWTQEIFPGSQAEQARIAVLTPDGAVGAVGFADGAVRAFIPGDLVYRTWFEISGSVRGVVLSADGQSLTAATKDGEVVGMPACPACHDPSALAASARATVAHAAAMGLVGSG